MSRSRTGTGASSTASIVQVAPGRDGRRQRPARLRQDDARRDRVRAHRRPTTACRRSTASRSTTSTPAQLRQTIRVVSEEPLLLAATLRDNLLLGAWGEIDDDAMLDAMRTAGADEVVGELTAASTASSATAASRCRAVSASASSLARALVAHPRVLILDDALSAVNPSLEIEIMRRVRRYLPQTAILYITRRTGLAALADRAVTLEPPEIVEPFEDVARSELLDGTAETRGERRDDGGDRQR